jgi:hypothetical protein
VQGGRNCAPLQDPEDHVVSIRNDLPFIDMLRKAGGKVEAFFVDSTDPEHHYTTPHAALVMRDCIRSASHDGACQGSRERSLSRGLSLPYKWSATRSEPAEPGRTEKPYSSLPTISTLGLTPEMQHGLRALRYAALEPAAPVGALRTEPHIGPRRAIGIEAAGLLA